MTNETPPDTTTDRPTQPSDVTAVERTKADSRRWIEVFNARDNAGEADVRTRDYVAYAPVSLEPAPLDSEAWTRFLAGFVEAFPDLRLTVEDAVAEGDLVAQRVHFEGTHTGEFQGLPPTHRKVTFSGLELNRFVDGHVTERQPLVEHTAARSADPRGSIRTVEHEGDTDLGGRIRLVWSYGDCTLDLLTPGLTLFT